MKAVILCSIFCIVAVASAWVFTSTITHSRTTDCQFPQTVVSIHFSQSKYPTIYQHYQDALTKGWPKVLVLDRIDASANRIRLLKGIPTKTGFDRDEYPPADGREGWLGDVEYVPSSENRSQGASMGAQLSSYCDGIRFQYDWTP